MREVYIMSLALISKHVRLTFNDHCIILSDYLSVIMILKGCMPDRLLNPAIVIFVDAQVVDFSPY